MGDVQGGLRPAAGKVCSIENICADRWRDAVCGLLPGLSIDWLCDQPKPAWVGSGPFAGARILELAGDTPVHVFCASSSGTASDTYDLVLQLAGRGRCRHAGREAAWEAGDLMLFDTTRSFDIVHPTGYHLLMWKLPRQALAPMLATPDRSVGLRIPGSTGPGAVLGHYARALVAQADRLDAITQRSLLMHLCGLVGLTLGATPVAHESRRDIRRAVQRQQALIYVETHLRDPCLTAERAAHALGISQRWLHALLEDGGISFSKWIARRRIQEARALLDDPAYDHLSITEVAFRSGFDNLSTFNRRFRAQYGLAPREARRLRD